MVFVWSAHLFWKCILYFILNFTFYTLRVRVQVFNAAYCLRVVQIDLMYRNSYS